LTDRFVDVPVLEPQFFLNRHPAPFGAREQRDLQPVNFLAERPVILLVSTPVVVMAPSPATHDRRAVLMRRKRPHATDVYLSARPNRSVRVVRPVVGEPQR